MSDLKHQDLKELLRRKYNDEKLRETYKARQGRLQGQINNVVIRLTWINHYIEKATPVELTIKEISEKLGYAVSIKEAP